ncbi:MAG: UV DNA damage repair endonuclease UvsE [Desulfomicrobium sp.]
MRFGLCCLFLAEKISFRATTAKVLGAMDRKAALAKASGICLHNADNLLLAVREAQRLGIGAFRITSHLFPRMTHPEVGYALEDLPQAQAIAARMDAVRSFAQEHDIRLSFHPDQFVVLSSPHAHVVENSVRELEYHALLAEMVGADVINIHGGGVYGDKAAALARFAEAFTRLPENVASRLSVENDDVSYTVADLLPLCTQLGLPLVYDAHHHRCNPDGLGVCEATELAAKTWGGREPYCHISSPREGWNANPKPHADYIDPVDIPQCWHGRAMTVDVEAKAKELAVVRLMRDIDGQR